ncbi:MAG: c-type cytochrome [Gemmatimonadota bacterium]|nr:c-type cytochrome [Gemmatimonadota bacterium]
MTLAAVVPVVLGCADASPPPIRIAPPTPPSAERRVPDGPLGASITRGLALLEHTADSLPAYVGANLRCTSCHLDRGLRENAAPLTLAHDRYPRFVDRTGAVVLIEDRVNYCFTRSLSGRALPPRSREMVDIVAYLAFISHATNGKVEPALAPLAADSARGGEVFAANCARCHGADGAGVQATPAVWGPRSFSVGASMARVGRAAAFVRRNMPFDKPGTLTDQQAYDVAAYINGHARPDLPGKALDWPAGNAPADVPYATRGHTPARVTPVIPRRSADGASVPPPASAMGPQHPE